MQGFVVVLSLCFFALASAQKSWGDVQQCFRNGVNGCLSQCASTLGSRGSSVESCFLPKMNVAFAQYDSCLSGGLVQESRPCTAFGVDDSSALDTPLNHSDLAGQRAYNCFRGCIKPYAQSCRQGCGSGLQLFTSGVTIVKSCFTTSYQQASSNFAACLSGYPIRLIHPVT